MSDYYHGLFRQLTELKEDLLRKRSDLLRTFLALQSTLLAVLSALLPTTPQAIAPRVLYLLTLVLLLLGALSSLVVLYDLVDLAKRGQEEFRLEALNALRDNRKAQAVMIEEKNRTKRLEIFSVVAFLLSLLLLIAYATILLFF